MVNAEAEAEPWIAGGQLPPTATLILERAAELFASNGFAGTSIRAIAEAAGVTKPTLYYYFGSKEGLIRHIIGGAMGAYAKALASQAEDTRPLAEVLVQIASGQLAYADAHPAGVTLICRLNHQLAGEPWAEDLRAHQHQGMAVLRERFAVAQARGEIVGKDPEVLAVSFLGALIMHTVTRLNRPEGGRRPDPTHVAEQLVALFLDGARPRDQEMP